MKILPEIRPCPECKGIMEFKLIAMIYEEKDSNVLIRVSSIPALVCTECGFELISIHLAKSLDVLVDTIFDSLKQQQAVMKTLPKANGLST